MRGDGLPTAREMEKAAVAARPRRELVYLELKSSPPKQLLTAEIAAFFGRLEVTQPNLLVNVGHAVAEGLRALSPSP